MKDQINYIDAELNAFKTVMVRLAEEIQQSVFSLKEQIETSEEAFPPIQKKVLVSELGAIGSSIREILDSEREQREMELLLVFQRTQKTLSSIRLDISNYGKQLEQESRRTLR